MRINIGATVVCLDGDCGQLHALLLNPANWQLTHLGVQASASPSLPMKSLHLVPLQRVSKAQGRTIHLACTIDDVVHSERYLPTEHRAPGSAIDAPGEDSMTTTSTSQQELVASERQRDTAGGKVAVGLETEVVATNGHVGHFEQLLVNRNNGLVTHVCFRCGHLWEQCIATIPASGVLRVEADTIYLGLDRLEVARLPSTLVRA